MNMNEAFCISAYEEQAHMAERELAAFLGAVTKLFGPVQARVSAEEWLDEAELMDSPPLSAGRDWRAVTVAASARLASRLTFTKVSPIPLSDCYDSTPHGVMAESHSMRCDPSNPRFSWQRPIEEYRGNPVGFEVAANRDPVQCCTRAE